MSTIMKSALEAANLADRTYRQQLAKKVSRLAEWQRRLIKITWLVILIPVLTLIGAVIFGERYFVSSIIILLVSFMVIVAWWWAKIHVRLQLITLGQPIVFIPEGTRIETTKAADHRNAEVRSAKAHAPGYRPPPPDTYKEIAEARIEAHQAGR